MEQKVDRRAKVAPFDLAEELARLAVVDLHRIGGFVRHVKIAVVAHHAAHGVRDFCVRRIGEVDIKPLR